MIMQSFYICEYEAMLVKFVKMQPNTKFFYKTFLELDGGNMTTILAFDGYAIAHLLSEENSDLFDPQFPIIYKTRIQKRNNKEKHYFQSALDISLKNN